MKAHTFAVIAFFAVPAVAGTASLEAVAEPGQGRAQNRENMRWRAMDTDGDGRITRAEWRGSVRAFEEHDWNNDGVLSGDEVRPGAVRPRQAASADDFHDWTDEGFRELDRNRDGRISRAEWQFGMQTFLRADRNNDGVLSRSEFLGYDSDDDEMIGRDRFAALDTNRNGRIERREWQGTRDQFDRLDRNNDGMVSRAEFLGDDADDDETLGRDRFAALDTNRNGRIERREWQGTRDQFDRLDRNNDGWLSRAETVGNAVDEPAGTFAALDTNRNGTLEIHEWPGTRRSFEMRDRNRDGRLTESEAGELRGVGTSGQQTDGAADTIRVDPRERWTDTGIIVRSGDRLQLRTDGTIILSENQGGNDTANAGGSLSGRRASGAPVPSANAGALIARIGDGQPFVIGREEWASRVYEGGRLFLGINDDHLGDNRGELRVRVSIER